VTETDLSNLTSETVVEIEAAPSAVWRALVEAEGLLGWFASEAEVEPRVGGTWGISHGGPLWGSKIETFEPERHLRIVDEQADAPAAVTDFYLEGRSGGTVLRLVQSGFASEEQHDSMSRGWAMYMENLRHYVERHAGEPTAQRYLYAKPTGAAEDVWAVLSGPDALDLAAADALDADPPRTAGVRSPELGDGIARVSVEGAGDERRLWVELIAYGDGIARLEAAAARWRALLDREFEPYSYP
jgi:uncharacterized protein YndB with AHSA1/START domain